MALIPAFPDPIIVPITLKKGATFYRKFTWELGDSPVDISLMTIRAKVRTDFLTAPVLTFTCTPLDAPNGQFSIEATVADIAALPVPSDLPASTRTWDSGDWDCELEDTAGRVVRLIEGEVTGSREVTS